MGYHTCAYYFSYIIVIWYINVLSFHSEQRQSQRFAGFSLYVSNDFDTMDISSRCYIDGYQLPPLNFTTTCITFGRYVTFYNERLDGIPYFEGYNNYVTGTDYTELCEVIVYGTICFRYIKFSSDTFFKVAWDTKGFQNLRITKVSKTSKYITLDPQKIEKKKR